MVIDSWLPDAQPCLWSDYWANPAYYRGISDTIKSKPFTIITRHTNDPERPVTGGFDLVGKALSKIHPKEFQNFPAEHLVKGLSAEYLDRYKETGLEGRSNFTHLETRRLSIAPHRGEFIDYFCGSHRLSELGGHTKGTREVWSGKLPDAIKTRGKWSKMLDPNARFTTERDVDIRPSAFVSRKLRGNTTKRFLAQLEIVHATKLSEEDDKSPSKAWDTFCKAENDDQIDAFFVEKQEYESSKTSILRPLLEQVVHQAPDLVRLRMMALDLASSSESSPTTSRANSLTSSRTTSLTTSQSSSPTSSQSSLPTSSQSSSRASSRER